jgi:Uma2 family endonuclease
MSAQADVPVRLTWQEFLRFEQAYAGDERHELNDGLVTLMTGGSERHDVTAQAIFLALSNAYPTGPCRVFIHNRKIRTSERSGYYPDVMVNCAPAADRLFETDARFVVEVVSPSNDADDRLRRLYAYQRLASIEAILFVDPVRQLATIHTLTDGAWHESQVRDGDVQLGSARVDFGRLWLDVNDRVTTD